MIHALLMLLFFFSGCSSGDEASKDQVRAWNQKGEYIYRVHDEYLFVPPPPEKVVPPPYPWDKGVVSHYPKITKEFFRCKGSSLNPVRTVPQNGEIVRYYDCGGSEKHSLPLRETREFIYPILIELVNYIQAKAGKRVVITCGHRCPEHHMYADPSEENQYSKHMIGAEVSFYVQGMEEQPDMIIKYIQDFYKESPKYQGQADYEEFKRYEKNDSHIATPPWYNKEIFVKLFKKKEGRDFDNRHPYPYISIQVRYDSELKEKVIYTWEKANRNYHRW
jgi:hypothetical protein